MHRPHECHRLALDSLDPDDLKRLLASPTLGRWRRAHGLGDGRTVYGRVAFARALVDEALRRAIIDRLDGILIALHRGADPRHVGRRLRALADLLDPPPCVDCDKEAA